MTERGINLLVDPLDLPLHQVNNNNSLFVRPQCVLVLVRPSHKPSRALWRCINGIYIYVWS